MRCEFNGIADQIIQHLLNFGVIALHRGQIGVNFRLEFHRLIQQQPLGGDGDIFENLDEINLFNQCVHLSGFNFGKIEDIVNQLQNHAGGLVRLGQVLQLFLRDFALQIVHGKRQIADQRVQRGAQFMAHAGKIIGFMPAGVLQLPVEVFQHGFRPFARVNFRLKPRIQRGQAAIALALSLDDAQIRLDAGD